MSADMKQLVLLSAKEIASSTHTTESDVCSLDDEFKKLSLSVTSPASSITSTKQITLLRNGKTLIKLREKQSLESPITRLWQNFNSILNEEPSKAIDYATSVGILAGFLAHIVTQITVEAAQEGNSLTADCLAIIYDALEGSCDGADVHATILSMASTTERFKFDSISSYFEAADILRRTHSAIPSSIALYRAATTGSASIYAVFGGQGVGNPLNELHKLNQYYKPILGNFVKDASRILEQLAAKTPRTNSSYPYGLEISAWMEGSVARPEPQYLTRAPVSFPLVGLLQLANYKILAKLLGCEPGKMESFFRGIGGHSQGVVTAIVASLADDWSSFDRLSLVALELLFWIGFRSQETFDAPPVALKALQDSENNGEGAPTCMLSVKGLDLLQVERVVTEVNAYLPFGERVEVTLNNGPGHVVIGGTPTSTYCFSKHLRFIKSPPGASQTRIPFSQRKHEVNTSYLPISAPFHSSHLEKASYLVLEDTKHLCLKTSEMKIPVYDTRDGEDLKSSKSSNLVPDLVRMIMTDRSEWGLTSKFDGATHVIDFGPGKYLEGVGALTDKCKQGSGVRTAVFSEVQDTSPDLGSRVEIFSHSDVVWGRHWNNEFGPKLLVSPFGVLSVETKFSKLLSLPPVMVAGMTPTTCSASFVAATMNAGYHIELATGGFSDSTSMEVAITEVTEHIAADRGVTCNLIYASPRALKWQLGLIRKLKTQGTPIEGLTIGAGVPSLEVARSYIQDFGIKHISFKPGSAQGIKQVVEIARANSHFPVILQWTGGRAGGHHSFEDFHAPIVQNYQRIRSCPNVILVGGSGFGDAKDSFKYLSGEWANSFGHLCMPFDGILIGSRAMVAVEAATSTKAKTLISQISGVPNERWEGSYEHPTGGILTVISEMGEPIHKIATRAVKLWFELDKTVFSIQDKSKRLKALQQRKRHIISRLNNDYSKVWFGRTLVDEVSDLEDMTYSQVLARLLDLTYLTNYGRWVHQSYSELVHEFLSHIESRFIADEQPLIVQPIGSQDPSHMLEQMTEKYPELFRQLISCQDQKIFTAICRKKGRKPVPFIIALDEHFEYYFKRDSLWQSENIEAVVNEDVQRLCILHGPVAAKYSHRIDETIKDILDGFVDGYVNEFTTRGVHAQPTSVLGKDQSCGADSMDDLSQIVVYADNYLAEEDENSSLWYEKLISSAGSAFGNFLTAKTVRSGSTTSRNSLRALFRCRAGIWIKFERLLSGDRLVSLHEADLNGDSSTVMELEFSATGFMQAKLTLYATSNGTPVALKLHYEQKNSFTSPFETSKHRNESIKNFYHQIWLGEENRISVSANIHDTFHGGTFKATANSMQSFLVATAGKRVDSSANLLTAPLDYAVVVAWKALIMPLFLVDGDLTKLVHLKNTFKRVPGASGISENDELVSKSRVTALVNQEAGILVEVTAELSRAGSAILNIVTQFFYRGASLVRCFGFRKSINPEMAVNLTTPGDVAVLRSKSWLQINSPLIELSGKSLIFKTQSHTQYPKNDVSTIQVTGEVFLHIGPQCSLKSIGTIGFTSRSGKDIVSGYLSRHGKAVLSRVMFEHTLAIEIAEPRFVAPRDNNDYAFASGDWNPIHLSRSFAAYAGLPGTITHGMYTSARVRDMISRQISGSDNQLLYSFSTCFTNMVLPEEEMRLSLQHIGMEDGMKIFSFQLQNASTNLTILDGEAYFNHPKTALLFTGQGSQQMGMGMALRQSSGVAKAIWDRADEHFLKTYGFRISNVVTDNPKELKVHFGGVSGGKIRDNYMSLTHEIACFVGTKSTPIFPGINSSTKSYTFRSDLGLLFTTQFTQPALTLMEIAIYEHLKSLGVLSDTNFFAGHSLGEYTAIIACGQLTSLETLMSIVFYRGLTMQVGIERDADGRSPFAMCALNPSKLSTELTQDELKLVVNLIATKTGLLLEIVNYNIDGQQYVCAGDIRALLCLTNVLDQYHEESKNFQESQDLKPYINDTVSKILLTIPSTPLSGKILKRGIATTPLAGIDVPFHSSLMKSGVATFRKFLHRHINADDIEPSRFIGRYIPNLTAMLFSLDKDYLEYTRGITGSPILEKVLNQWDELWRANCGDLSEIIGLLQSIRT